MTTAFLVSHGLLWLLVILLSLLVFALARQVGVLHERVAPAGALMPTTGPAAGDLTEPLVVPDIRGSAVSVGGASQAGTSTLILFVSPTCPICRSIVPVAVSLAAHEGKRLRLLFASDGDTPARHLDYMQLLGIESFPYLLSQALGLRYSVSKLPFAVLIGADGVLRGKGLVNSREHLESLVEAMDSGIASIQDYVERFGTDFDRVAREQAL